MDEENGESTEEDSVIGAGVVESEIEKLV